MNQDDVPDDDADGPRQRIERVPGRRRARLTPAPGSGDEPVAGDEDDRPAGANDERMRRDVPPHY